MTNKRVFVTVGTTKFERLIETVSKSDVLTLLRKLGYGEVQFQTGEDGSCNETVTVPGITTHYDSYFEDFRGQIEASDLIIGHAGAGTCLEVLRQGKPLIAVVNDSLMDNHQTELAKELQSHGYIFFCTCDTLRETLQKDLNLLKEYPTPNESVFSSYLDKCMGFS